MKIAGATIVYLPNYNDLIKNINSYINQVERLYIILNSSIEESTTFLNFCLESSKIELIQNPSNYGIAKALNQAAECALKDEYEWLLTMDQDSIFYDSEFFDSLKNYQNEKIAIYCPNPLLENYTSKPDTSFDNYVMTSGSIVKLKCWEDVSGFDSKLFIDEVDHDFSLRLRKKRYLLLQFNNIHLNHNLGYIKRVKKKQIILHSPERTYYIFRNGLYVIFKYSLSYPKFALGRIRNLILELNKILFYSDKKIKRFQLAFKGVFHFIIHKYGPLK